MKTNKPTNTFPSLLILLLASLLLYPGCGRNIELGMTHGTHKSAGPGKKTVPGDKGTFGKKRLIGNKRLKTTTLAIPIQSATASSKRAKLSNKASKTLKEAAQPVSHQKRQLEDKRNSPRPTKRAKPSLPRLHLAAHKKRTKSRHRRQRLAKDKAENTALTQTVSEDHLDNGAELGLEDKYKALKIAVEKGQDKISQMIGEKIFEELTALAHDAEEQGELNTFLEAHKDDIKIGCTWEDDEGYTPLHYAAQQGDLELVKKLVEHWPEEESVDIKTTNQGKTPLHLAASRGHLEVVKCLIEAKADVHQEDEDGWSIIDETAEQGRTRVVEFLCGNGVDINKSLRDNAFNGIESAVRTLLRAGADIDAKDGAGNTALTQAVLGGHVEVVALLLDNGAELGLADKYEALKIAVEKGQDEISQMLGEKIFEELTVLAHDAEAQSKLEEAFCSIPTDLLKIGCTWEDDRGYTASHYAAQQGDLKLVKKLVEHWPEEESVDIKTTDRGRTPLHLAASRGHLEVVDRLVKRRGAKVDEKDFNGGTALHYATMRRHVQVVKFLLEVGAETRVVDNDGFTLLHIAAEANSSELMDELLKTEAKDSINQKNVEGANTALHIAVSAGHIDMVEKLLNAGANKTEKNQDEQTALDIATVKGYEGIKGLLTSSP